MVILTRTTNEPTKSPFVYLPDEDSEALDQTAFDIQLDIAVAFASFDRIAYRLLDAETKLRAAGRFQAWCKHHFRLSYQTLRSYMEAVRNLSPEMVKDELVGQKIKYILSRNIDGKAPEEWRLDTAARLIASGRMDEDAAMIVRYASERQIKDFETETGDNSKANLAAFITAMNKLKMQRRRNAPLIYYIERWKVSRAEVVEYLTEVYKRHVLSQNTNDPSKTWLDLVEEDGTMNGFGWSMHVSHPDAHTQIWQHRQARQRLRAMEAVDKMNPVPSPEEAAHYTWTDPRFAAVVIGADGIALQPDPDLSRRLAELLPKGGSIVITARLPIPEDHP